MPPPFEVTPDGVHSRSASEWLTAVRDAERRGELLMGFDLASRGLEEHPADADLRYRAVLALARAGSTAEATRQFDSLALGAIDTEDVAALRARLEKDEALAAEGDDRRQLAARAAASYRAICERTRGYFPAINAATLSLVAGDRAGATAQAQDALRLVAAAGESSYYSAATEAEALLLVGDVPAAKSALARAASLHGGDYGAVSTTRRQLRLVCSLRDIDPTVLGALAGPAVAHFCGHRVSPPGELGRFVPAQVEVAARRMSAVVQDLRIGIAYGSLASGADILWAEAILAAGGEINIVLPFALEEFVAVSVAPSGSDWADRFNACLERAASLTYVTEGGYMGDDELFRYCADSAMGLALLRARFLDASAVQLALWDGERAVESAGTAMDVEQWHAPGRHAVVVRPDGSLGDPPTAPVPFQREQPTRAVAEQGGRQPARVVKALLFGDISGYSRLADEQLPAYARVVLGAFAEVLSRYRAEVDFANTWGDALFAVLSSAPAAARCALDLQECLAAVDLEAEGLPAHFALRVSGHVGPVFPVLDPVIGQTAFMGAHVSRTARIEPVTPPGAVYVTEAFGAALSLAGEQEVRCDYVGHLPTAKDYGKLRMYRVWRRAMNP